MRTERWTTPLASQPQVNRAGIGGQAAYMETLHNWVDNGMDPDDFHLVDSSVNHVSFGPSALEVKDGAVAALRRQHPRTAD